MGKIVGIVCYAMVFMLLSGCGGQLASEAQKAADQIAAEASKTASKKLDEFKNLTLEQLKTMRGEGSGGKAVDKSETKPADAANSKAGLRSTKLFVPRKVVPRKYWT